MRTRLFPGRFFSIPLQRRPPAAFHTSSIEEGVQHFAVFVFGREKIPHLAHLYEV